MARQSIIGWKLETGERDALLARFLPLFPDVIADHVTFQIGANAATPLPRETGGDIVGQIDDTIGLQALVLKIGGTTDRPGGGTFHITWSLDRARGRRPAESNVMLAQHGWRHLVRPVPVLLLPARLA